MIIIGNYVYLCRKIKINMKRPIFFWMLSALLLFSCGNDKSHYELTHEVTFDKDNWVIRVDQWG